MSGAEIFGLVVNIIALTETCITVYNAIKDLDELPKAFEVVGDRLPLVQETLELVKAHAKLSEINSVTQIKALKGLLEGCHAKAKALCEIFAKIQAKTDNKSLIEVYKKMVLKLKHGRVETLMQGVLQDLQVLETYAVFKNAVADKAENLRKAEEELAKVEPSLPDSESEIGSFHGRDLYNLHDSSSVHHYKNKGDAYNAKNMSFGYIHHATFERHDSTRSQNDYQERIAVLKWLSPLKFAKKHDEIQDKVPIQRHDNVSLSGDWTGKWLLESEPFNDWRARKISRLWYHGKPGAGKTVLASIITEHMRKLVKELKPTSEIGKCKVAFLYLGYQEKYSIEHLVGSVIRQLIEDETQLPEVVLQSYRMNARNDEENASKGVLSSLLCSLASEWPLYIVLDALDEYRGMANDDDGGDSMCKRLLSYLVPDVAKKGSINILILSRLLDEFRDLSENFYRVDIEANKRDIAIFVDHEFDNKKRLQEYAKNDPDLRGLVKETIIQRCGGMFLLARLHMNALVRQRTKANLLEQLRTLPDGIDKMYDEILNRLSQISVEEDHDLAWNSLAWIVLSKRRLQTTELQHALACSTGAQKLDPNKFPHLDDVQELCGGLVEHSNGTVVLVHYTAQSYLDTRADDLFAEFHNTIAQSCVKYIGFFSLAAISGRSGVVTIATTGSVQCGRHRGTQHDPNYIPHETSLWTVFEEFPFLEYAISHLRHHLQKQTPDATQKTLDMLIQLLNDQGKRNFLLNGLQKQKLYPTEAIGLREDPFIEPIIDTVFSESSVDLETCFFRPRSTTRHSMEEEEEGASSETRHEGDMGGLNDDVESSRSSPTCSETQLRVYRAIDESANPVGHIQSGDSVLEAFLGSRMEWFSLTTELESADQGQEFHLKAMVWSIMGKINTHDGARQSTEEVAQTDATEVMNHARETQSQPDVETLSTSSDLEWTDPYILQRNSASRNGDWFDASLLHLAACLGWTPLVNHIAQSSSDVNAVDFNGLTPLCIAAQTGNFEAVEVILSYEDASVDLSIAEGHAILLHLAQSRRSHLIEQILYRTISPLLFVPIPLALQVCSFIISKILLLLWGIQIDWRVWVPQPVKHQPRCCLNDLRLLDAAHRGDLSTIKELVDGKKVDLQLQKPLATLAIFLAVASCRVDVVDYLIDHGVDVNSSGLQGMTPLHLATRLNERDMMERLLAKCANVRAKDDHGNLAWMAILHVPERKELLGLFKKYGVDLDAFDPAGGTPLYWASCAGDIELVEFLLDNEANASQTTRYLWAPLHYAAHNGHLDCVHALLRNGAELSPMSDQSKTPLDMARQSGQSYIAQLLRDKGAKTAQEIRAERGSAFPRSRSIFTRTPDMGMEILENEFDSDSESDDEQSVNGTRLVDSFFLLVRNWDKITFSDEQVAQSVRDYLRRDINELMQDFVRYDLQELYRVTSEDISLWNELITRL